MLMEQMQYNLLFRWFVGLGMDDEVWDVTVFTKNRERLLEGEIAGRFFDRVMEPAREAGLLSDEHFTVEETLIVEMCPSCLPSQTGDQPLPLCTPVLLRTMTTRRHALLLPAFRQQGLSRSGLLRKSFRTGSPACEPVCAAGRCAG